MSGTIVKKKKIRLLYDISSMVDHIKRRTGTGIFTVSYNILKELARRSVFDVSLYSSNQNFSLDELKAVEPFMGKLKVFNGDYMNIDVFFSPKEAVPDDIKYQPHIKKYLFLYDLTPFFERNENKIKIDKNTVVASTEKDDELEKVTDTDVFIAVNSLWTNPTMPITNFAGSAQLRNGIGVNEIHLIGNFSNNQQKRIKFDYVPRPNNEFLLSVDSNDAGATLKALRVYDNMQNGIVQIEARRTKDKTFIGHAKIRNFSIYNTPVIAKLLTVASFSGMVDLLKGEGLKFSHLDAPFEYQNKQLRLKDAKAFGDVVGITATGTYDRRFDDVNVNGVIAPAYSLNTMLGRIPLVGGLLVGKDGTVFAANYTVTGNLEDADININPLSALSPSSLKDKLNELFGNANDN